MSNLHKLFNALLCKRDRSIFRTLLWRTLIALIAFTPAMTVLAAPVTQEFQAGVGGPAGNGPSIANQSVTMRTNTNNPTGTTFAAPTNPVTVTLSLSNFQHSVSTAALSTGRAMNFGSSGGVGTAIYGTLNSIGSPSDAMFSSLPSTVGQGISITQNGAIELGLNTLPLQGVVATNTRNYYGDLTISFSRPLTNPTIHLSGLGGSYGTLGITAELDLDTAANPSVTLSKISGTSNFRVTTTQILNNAINPSASCAAAVGACGSVLATGNALSSLKFKVYLRGDGGFASWGVDKTVGDAFYFGGVSLQDEYDYGDAPAPYGTPFHAIVSGIKLGAIAPDIETAAQPNVAATGDDTTGTDDEDAIASFPALTPGATTYSLNNIPVTNTTGGTATLYGWVDFNRNNRFDGNEAATATVANGATTASLNWSGLSGAIAGQSYVRLRLNTQVLTNANSGTPTSLDTRSDGAASDGEVEDYALTIASNVCGVTLDNNIELAFNSGNGVLESGTYYEPGSTYRVSNMSPGIDGIITLNSRTSDSMNNLLYGHLGALLIGTQETMHFDMTLRLVNTGTSTTISTPVDLVLSSLDIDGDAGQPYSDGVIFYNADATFSNTGSKLQPTYYPDHVLYTTKIDARGYNDQTTTDPAYGAGAVYKDVTSIHYGGIVLNNTINSSRTVLLFGTLAKFNQITPLQCNPPEGSVIRGTVYMDSNRNNVFDTGEPTLPNISVSLYDDNGTPANTSDDTLLVTSPTELDGRYNFGGVNSSRTYRITVNTADVDLPASAIIGTINPLTGITVTAGGITANQNFGFDPANTAQPPLTCDSSLYQISADGSTGGNSYLRKIIFSGGSATFSNIGSGAGSNVNGGYGYNPVDNYIYGLSYDRVNNSGPFYMHRVGSDGSFVNLGQVTGLPSGTFEVIIGDVLPNGKMLIRSKNNDSTYYVIDLVSNPLAVSNTVTFTGLTLRNADWAYNPQDNSMYSIDQADDRMVKVDLTTNVASFIGSATLTGQYGAHWFDQLGNYYVYENLTGDFFQVDLQTGAATKISSGVPTSDNDGTSCRGAPPVPMDFGDAPVAYGHPNHVINGLKLGATVDSDTTVLSGTTALGDDSDGTDDEDAIASFPALTAGATAYSLSTIPVTNTTGSTATLYGWVDFNRNNRFDGNEAATASVANGATTASLNWSGLSGVTAGQSYVRLRLTTQALSNTNSGNLTLLDTRSTVAASNGEVEDYALTVSALVLQDYSDAPASYGDAPTKINSNIYLGSTVPDSETTGNYDYRAIADGTEEDGAPQSQWGVNLFPILIETATSYATPITVNNGSGSAATLEGWIDVDHSGTFDADERTTVTVPNGTSGPVSLNWPSLPSDLERGTTYIRLRLTNDLTGAGEVEDHVISIALVVPPESPDVTVISGETVRSCQAVVFEDNFNDLTAGTYLAPNRPGSSTIRDWTTTGGGEDTYAVVQSQGVGDQAVYLGNGTVRRISPSLSTLGGLNFDSNGRLTSVINAIELRSGADDTTPGVVSPDKASSWGPDEVVFSRTFASVAGKTYRLYFTGIPEGGDYVDGMMRIDTPVGSAHFLSPTGSSGSVNYAIEFTATSNSSTIAIANYGHIGSSNLGWCNPQHTDLLGAAWCTQDGTTDSSSTNEVTVDDIYLVEAACDSDYSDGPADNSSAPDGSNTTAYGVATHDNVSGIQLGSSITIDTSAVEDADNASDDGVTIPALTQGEITTITATVAGAGGYLQAWIDWNGDGDFDDTVDGISEQISVNAQDNTTTVSGRTDDADTTLGQISLQVDVPVSATTNQTFARFRWSTTAGLDSTTAASDGEVEDYALSVTQPAVTGPTICTGATLPANAVTLSFANASVNWPVNTYTPQTFTNIENAGVDMTISVSNSSTFSGVSESNTNTGNGDTAPFFITTGLGAGTSTFTLDLTANPSSFVDLCTYHINQVSGGDRVRYRAVTNVGTILTQPTFGPASAPSYNLSSDTADAFTYTTILNGLLGVNFQAPIGELIQRVELVWSESSGSTGGMHGVGFGEISFDAPPPATYDYSDAPAPYGTPNHTIVSGIKLGATAPDAESAAQPNTAANLDDTTGTDDEDAISSLPALTAGASTYSLSTIPVTNTTGSAATLYGWVDFNRNNRFDGNEAATASVANGATTASLNWSGLSGVTAGQSYVRLRLTTQALSNSNSGNLTLLDTRSTVAASNGEVEDYALTAKSVASSCVAVPVTTLGDATVNANNEYILTQDLNNRSGFIWSNDNIDLNQPFDIQLGVYLGSNAGVNGTGFDIGADGMSFILQNDPRGIAAEGSIGGHMGVDGEQNLAAYGYTNRGVYPSLTVEFDTFDNTFMGFTGDIADDHTGIYLNGDVTIPQASNVLKAATSVGTGGEIEDGQYHITRYIWNPTTKNLTYYFDGAQIASVTYDLIPYFGSPYVRFGFAAATGGSKNLQKACWLDAPAMVDPGYNLTGTIFEDINYGGGAGRDLATASGAGTTAASVELYDASGNLADTTTTAADGTYTFNNVLDGSYYVRVVSDTVNSTRTGTNGSELGVQTFRTDGTTAVTGEVGGRKPAVADGAANGGAETLNTTTFALSGGGAVQSLQLVTVAGADIAGIDFGFNFDTIVNTNDSGQGSLRQFILNSNLLTDIPNQGINAGYETSIFMIADGTAYAGTESHGTQDLTTAGVALITPVTMLPAVTNPNTAIDGTTQHSATCGDPLSATPHTLKIQLTGSTLTSGAVYGIKGADLLARGLSITGFKGGAGSFSMGLWPGANTIVQCSYFSVAPDGTTLSRNGRDIATLDAANVLLGGLNTGDGNVFAGGTSGDTSVYLYTSPNLRVFGNSFGMTPNGQNSLGVNQTGLSVIGPSSNFVIGGATASHRNLFASGIGVQTFDPPGSTRISGVIQGNYIGVGYDGLTPVAHPTFTRAGIWLANNVDALIGGGGAGEPNIIAGGFDIGIQLTQDSHAQITNNLIGVGVDQSTPLGMRDTAILVQDSGIHTLKGNIIANSSNGNSSGFDANIYVMPFTGTLTIGGTTPGEANTIYGGAGHGVKVRSGANRVFVSGNSIYANGGLAINLMSPAGDIITTNDANDADSGGNALLNFPQFKQSIMVGSNLIISGCAPAGASIELFEADVSPTSTSGVAAGSNQFSKTQDYGEGESFLSVLVEGVAEDVVTTPVNCATLVDADGNSATGMSPFQWTIPLPAALIMGDKITATATLAGMGTSEFSAVSTVSSFDYGDAPGYADAVHVIDGLTYLGTAPDVDTGTITTNGDASDDANDDGVFTDAALSAGLQGTSLNIETSVPLHVSVVGSGKLYAWVDWNGNGVFSDAGEQIANGIAGTDETLVINANVPLNANPGTTYARFRFSSDAAAVNPTGAASNGEVEDYQVAIANNPIAPTSPSLASCSNTWAPAAGGGYESVTASGVTIKATASAGANHSWSFSPNDALNTAGVFSEAAFNGTASLSTVFIWDTSPEDGRLADAADDAETGTLTFTFDVPVKNPVLHLDRIGGYGGSEIETPQGLSNSSIITPNAANSSATFTSLAGTSHFNVTTGTIQRTPNETMSFTDSSGASGTDSSRYTAMGSVQINGTYNALSLDFTGVGVEGAGADGMEFVVCALPFDYGDAPNSYGEATHEIPETPTVYLGSVAPDSERLTQNTVNGGADGTGDNADGINDEDAYISLPPAWTSEPHYRLKMDCSAQGSTVAGWIDWNQNNVFDTGERNSNHPVICAASKSVTLNWTGLSGLIAGNTFARIRVASNAAEVANPDGNAVDGEVEDYAFTMQDPGTKPGVCNGVMNWFDVGGQSSDPVSTWNVDWPGRNVSAQFNFSTTMQGTNPKWTASAAPKTFTNTTFATQFGGQGNMFNVSYPNLLGSGGSTLADITFAQALPGKTYLVVRDIDASDESMRFSNSNIGALPAPSLWESVDPLTDNNPSIFAGWDSAQQKLITISDGGNNNTESYVWDVSGLQTLQIEYTTYAGTAEVGFVSCIPQDFGDAPDTYTTTNAAGGAQHGIINDVYLGNTKPDVDSDGQPGAGADRDGSDEEGISLFSALTTSDRTYSLEAKVTNATNDSANLIAWVDFDGNGTFDADEAAIRSVPTGANLSTITLTWSDIPVDIKTGNTYLRVRLTTDSLNNSEPSGAKRDGEVEDYPLTITTAGVTVSGRVFRDSNVNAANDSGETGVTELPVVLYDAVNDSCISTRTDGNGNYAFNDVIAGTYQVYEASRESVPVPTNCGPTYAKNPGGYLSTTENVTAEFTVSNADITDQDFGDIKPPVFEPDNTGQVLAGNVVFYTHKLSTPTAGNVSFASVNSGNVITGWSSIIYQDVNCDGQLNGGDASAPVTGLLPVAANDAICLINKVYAPSNVAANDSYVQKITATFDYGNAIAGTSVLEVQDVTTAQQVQAPTTTATPAVTATDAVVSQPAQNATPNVPGTETAAEVPSTPYTPATDPVPAQVPVPETAATPEVGPSRLELRKTVKNTSKAPYTETATANTAQPGDTLEYRIYYSNTGTGPVTDLVINDTVPPYTSLVGTADCGTPPAGMGCTASALGLDDSLSWTFTGSLTGGSKGSVSYQVLIDD